MTSIFATPHPNLPIREGSPALVRPSKEELAQFPAQAQQLLTDNWTLQSGLLEQSRYDLSWLAGRHVLLAGATGPGLGGSLATAVLRQMKKFEIASLTVIGRDLSKSLGYETGKALQAQADGEGLTDRFNWLNTGIDLSGKPLTKALDALAKFGAKQVVYVNTVAAALSGLLPGMPPVFVRDVDENGPFQWQLQPLSEKEIGITKYVMGEMAVSLPHVLRENGVEVQISIFADWRGSLDKVSRDPTQREYGRQGAYSTSLYMPKDILQQATREAYGTSERMIDLFLPVMRTRALSFIPGGMLMADVNEMVMRKEGVAYIEVPELALGVLDVAGKAVTQGYDNPFPRLDSHDAHLDPWMFEVLARLNNNEDSEFYYKRWMP